jgi:3-oxoacyl-[acyl-carrier-protein] synthase III
MRRVEEPRTYMVAADSAAAAVVGPARPGEGILGVYLGNKGGLGGTVQMPHPRRNMAFEPLLFTVPNKQMGDLAIEMILKSTREVLAQSGLCLDDMAWVLPHQPNGQMFEAIVRALGVDRKKLVPMVQEMGTTGAASIPVTLDRLRRTRDVAPGDRILMVSVGSGVSYGAMIYQVAP